ncbi:hypothetical protein MKY95_21185 [Paenibacillus sp. FSL P4-0176]
MSKTNEFDDRKLLREIGYEESLLETMSDEDCAAEVNELKNSAD